METKMKKECGSGDINRKQRQTELSFLHAILHIDLYHNLLSTIKIFQIVAEMRSRIENEVKY